MARINEPSSKPVTQPKVATPKPVAKAAPAPAKAAAKPFQPGSSGISGFFHKVESEAEKVIGGAKNTVENRARNDLGLESYPTSKADRAAREQQIDAQVAQMKLQPGAQQALKLMAAQGVSPVDIWQGSHIIVNDGGKLYEQLSRLPGAEARQSSHYPGVKCTQYGLEIGGAELLTGKTADGQTWFQMEAHPFHGGAPKDLGQVKDDALHLLDYGKYRAVNENIGPLGISPHTEHSDPIRLG